MLKRAWQAWKRLAHRVGNFQARILLTIFYGVLAMPFGFAVRLFSDRLRIKQRPTNWLHHPDNPSDFQWAKRQ